MAKIYALKDPHKPDALKMRLIKIRLMDEMWKEIKRRARRLHISATQWIRDALEHEMRHPATHPQGQPPTKGGKE